ncbi:MAG: trypsin-like serine protease [Longispora sp.]|nr:trypsin-like serine protease [Longispora sp. (in: high G+C Gram-positive bacteria)]
MPQKLWAQKECVDALGGIKVTASMVCAGPLDLTQIAGVGMGDSGGPLLVDIDGVPTVIAVASHGKFAPTGPFHVTKPNQPTIFIRVDKFIDWIDAVRDGIAEQHRAMRTIAGDGEADFHGDGGLATAAQLRYPGGVTVDTQGSFVIADTLNHRIRRIDSNGTITTVAGIGGQAYGGDGGQATDAQLSGPMGVTLDLEGNIVFTDTGNHRIRRIDAKGTITTIAGSGTSGFDGDGRPATAARLDSPAGVAVDAKGHIVFADMGNHRIRRIDAKGIITTVAGSGVGGFSGDGRPAAAAQLKVPSGVAVDANGNIIIADTLNHRVRRVSPAGVITTVAGIGKAGFGGDGETATAAQLNTPFGVAVEAGGNILVADTLNNRIRRVDVDGTIATIAGDDESGFDGNGGPPSCAQLYQPHGIMTDTRGNVAFADTLNNRIRQFSLLDS